MPECPRCEHQSPTALAYGTEVFVCCGYPLVNTERSSEVTWQIENTRLSLEAKMKRYCERISILESKLADAEVEARGFTLQDKLKRRLANGEQTIAGLKRLLTEKQRRGAVAMVVVMLKELAHQHTMAENMAASVEGGRCPLPGQAALTYNVLSDALRYALDVSSKDLADVLDLLEPMDPLAVGKGAGLPRSSSPTAWTDERDDALPEECGGADPAQRDFYDFWHRSE